MLKREQPFEETAFHCGFRKAADPPFPLQAALRKVLRRCWEVSEQEGPVVTPPEGAVWREWSAAGAGWIVHVLLRW